MEVLPAEYAEDEVEHEEAAYDDEGDEEDPVEGAPYGIVGLKTQTDSWSSSMGAQQCSNGGICLRMNYSVLNEVNQNE